MKTFFVALLLLCVSSNVMAQKPTWLNGYHKDLVYSYLDVFSAVGNTIDEARSKALQQIVAERSRATGHSYVVKEVNGSVSITGEDNIEVKSRVVDQYQETAYGGYKVSLLVQTARNPMYSFEPVYVTDRYSAGARAVIPGWAQLYKGQTTKGLVMLTGVVGCGIGALVCENTRSDYKNKMKEQPEFAKTYNTKANNYETARNVFIGAAAAFYVWNIIDGVASKGKRRVFVGKSSSLSYNPIVTPDAAGLALTYNF